MDEKRQLFMIDSLDTSHGMSHVICRQNLYDDCISLYEDKLDRVLKEFPFRIKFQDEKAVDTGGVARDMYSAFWELSYVKDFDGGSSFVPLTNPHINLDRYKVLGTILCHGFMSTGFLPIRLCFPVIAYTLLGVSVSISNNIMVNSFVDFLSTYDSSVIREALSIQSSKTSVFPKHLQDALINILGRMDCREVPTPANLQKIIVDISRYELTVKPLAALNSIRMGVPTIYNSFWKDFSVKNLYDFYKTLCVSPASVLSALSTSDSINSAQNTVLTYLKTFIGNMVHEDLRNFLRFVTGSSVLIEKKITITFNCISGLSRRPISHTCSSTLELSTAYHSYPEFSQEFLSLLRSEIAWPMNAL